MRSRATLTVLFAVSATTACPSTQAPSPAVAPVAPPPAPAPAPIARPTSVPGPEVYVIPQDAQDPTMALRLGTHWSLPCKRTGAEPVAALDCQVDQIKNVDAARLAHIKCNVVDPTIGDISSLNASQWLIAMRGGIWSVLDPKDLWWSVSRIVLPNDIAALRRHHPMIASPPRDDYWREQDPVDQYAGTLYWHMNHDGDWCERQMPVGGGGGEHFYVQCFDLAGQLRGVALAKRDSARIATACGSLADIPSWIFER